MPTILINTNVTNRNNDKKEYDKKFDDEFRNDLNELINKLLVKSNMVRVFDNIIIKDTCLLRFLFIHTLNYYSLIHFQSNTILTI
jgi:hypothetical protein